MPVTGSGPTMSRRHAAGADSARSLLFTVLGEFVLPDGGRAWTSTIIDALSRLDVEEKAIRQALMRTAADGWLSSERFGRRTLWCLTPKAEQLLTDGTERIYGFTGPTTDWDGQWLLALARVPETDRPARHLLRTRMSWAGFGSLAPGMWISPHTDRLDEARRILGEAGVHAESRVFVARDVTGGDEAEMAKQAWDLAALEQDYRSFLADYAGDRPADPIARLIGLVHRWRRFPWIDPSLPRQLLPPRWSGTKAAQLFQRQHGKWSAAAQAEWARLRPTGQP
jgi:phenylacetic acid degradation operon negative regulatory protein